MNSMRKFFAEALGTGGLLAVVVGSGIMAERLAGGNVALALLANALATGAGLFVLIVTLAPVSGAHFNPIVSLSAWRDGALSTRALFATITAQIIGAILGVLLTHAMFELPFPLWSEKVRHGSGQWIAEAVASFGLVLLILRLQKQSVPLIAAAVGLYITAAYWFTASTSFANPAVTIARAFSNTFAGILPADVPYFILAQLVGLLLARGAHRLLGPVQYQGA
ncbi:MAG: aquaporin family protein [Burkholderiaceae bacterium]|nr:MAG: aquaporin family protein [Burkholderiaceae bacterium]